MSFNFDLDTKEEWMGNTAPIFSFPKLKERLITMGIKIGKADTYKKINSVDVLPEDIGERLVINNDGIFYIDDNDNRHHAFLYKRHYHLNTYGKPRIHTCRCQTINAFMNSSGSIPEYRVAETDTVMVLNWDNNNEETEVSNLPLCKFCASMLFNNKIQNSKDFEEILSRAATREPTELELDYYGYVKDWEEISLAYRTKLNFTCERCGTHVKDFDHAFIQTHHKNGDKTNNKETNLECLCIHCHANVDDVHRRNFSIGGKPVMLQKYLEKYHPSTKKESIFPEPKQSARKQFVPEDDLPF